MRLPTRPRLALGDVRIGAGLVKLAILCGFIVALGMIRPRLDPDSAGLIVLVCGIVTLLGALGFVAATRRTFAGLPVVGEGTRVASAVLVVLRRTGLPFLGLAFFLFWTFVYLGLWWFNPESSFTGLDANPRFADFFYYSVTTAFISPPGDIAATSRGARSATMIEMLTGFALLTAYLSSFVDLARRRQAPAASDPDDAATGD